ncbi:MAG TPA: hypothetical protein VNZ53_32975 [Steroidobacteraceae bacterium]|nr:hypothetical protein [Steroidobacteraceae bacterium]
MKTIVEVFAKMACRPTRYDRGSIASVCNDAGIATRPQPMHDRFWQILLQKSVEGFREQ